jgi:16S rRNA processing protein RimM
MTSQFVRVGRVKKTHGYKGMLLIHLDYPDSIRYDSLKNLYMGTDPARLKRCEVSSVKRVHNGILVQPAILSCSEEPARLNNTLVWLAEDQLKQIDDQTFYHYQLKGMTVNTTEGRYLGVLDEIVETGANDVYVVRDESTEHLIPAIKSVVKRIDIESKTMLIEPMRNMLESG